MIHTVMDPVNPPAKAPPSRPARSRATRLRISQAAYALFCERGYGSTTMADIAARAGVAVQTVYFVFHTKSHVLGSTYGLAVMGEVDPAIPQEQAWYASALAEPDMAVAVRWVVEGAGEMIRRVAPLDLAVRTAAETDPDAAAFLDDNEQRRLDGYRAMIDFLRAKANLRPSLTPERATHVMLFLVGPAAYRALVFDLGWSHVEWVEWTTTALVEGVFGLHDRE
jgi:AcrR family transcriptional regulator